MRQHDKEKNTGYAGNGLVQQLIEALRCLPGVGPKSAQRMAFYLLQYQRQRGLTLAACLEQAMQEIRHCERCNNYTEQTLCKLCQHTTRDRTVLCVVENPSDLYAIEQCQAFQGLYFVLMGKISPIDGLGPNELRLPQLRQLVISEQITEVILALSASVEGQTTVHFIQELLRDQPTRVSQLAQGLPSNSELDGLDSHTIRTAVYNRSYYHVPT